MTTEDDFQAALDANPNDRAARIAFAAHLEANGDPRAAGYRAMCARWKFRPQVLGCAWWYDASHAVFQGGGSGKLRFGSAQENRLPGDWYAEAVRVWRDRFGADLPGAIAVCFDTRRQAEDAAARAFAQLPHARRMQLLALTAEEVTPCESK